jgi:RNA polymerase sigma-70 factor, ECF subfamily
MESQNRYDGINAYAVTKIRFQSRQLACTRAFRFTDVEDLEQELMLDLLCRLPAFDPSRSGRNTFIARIVENHAATLIKAALAEKRGAAVEHESLHTIVHEDTGDPIELGDTLPTENGLWDAGGRGWVEVIDLRYDLIRAIGGLPPHLVSLCGRLATGTVTEVASATGMSRPSIYDGVAKVRAALAKVGLGTSC